ncbi:hypothetical protein [Helicobacter suis]|uniref:hypothetical protein n=1 Tax=Helicobacter suis TaxID=104628 RepID=UPI0013CFC0D3|nr:hypothetical protein [Helicobacter suis]
MKKILWIFVLFSFSCLQAYCFEGKVDSSFNTFAALAKWTKQLLVEAGNKGPSVSFKCGYFSVLGNTQFGDSYYTFLVLFAEAYQHKKKKDEGFCLGIIEKKGEESALYKGFCLEGFSQIDLHNTNNPKVINLVLYKNKALLVAQKPPKPDTKKPLVNYLTFQFFKDRFYLTHFSDNTNIFFNHVGREFPMYAVNNALLNNLLSKQTNTEFSRTDTYTTKITLDGLLYTLINQTTSNQSQKKLSSCLEIKRGNTTLRGKFCLDGLGKANFVYKKNYITLEFSGPLGYGINRKAYLTFKIVRGIFYLHQYSEQNSKVNKDGSIKILRTQIIYRQNRDDPQNKNPITLDTLNSNYQRQLLDQCIKRGYCM